jgi:hypothetical protein
MKKLLTVALALAALSILAPQAGFAQAWNNQLGIYTDPAGDPVTSNYDATPFTQFYAYLVLTDPVNHSFAGGVDTARPITQVSGFECKVTMPASELFSVTNEFFPADAIDVGAKPSYAVGFASPVPVVGGTVVLNTWRFMVDDDAQYDIFMDITRFPSLPGVMAILDAEDTDDPLSPVYVSTGDFAVPVFSINGTAAVAIESDTWGGVKSLFR